MLCLSLCFCGKMPPDRGPMWRGERADEKSVTRARRMRASSLQRVTRSPAGRVEALYLRKEKLDSGFRWNDEHGDEEENRARKRRQRGASYAPRSAPVDS